MPRRQFNHGYGNHRGGHNNRGGRGNQRRGRGGNRPRRPYTRYVTRFVKLEDNGPLWVALAVLLVLAMIIGSTRVVHVIAQ